LRISTKKQFLESIKRIQNAIEIKKQHSDLMTLQGIYNVIKNESFTRLDLSNTRIDAFIFINCIFEECNFGDSVLHESEFNDCNFLNCEFTYTRLIMCDFKNSSITGGSHALYAFADCTFTEFQFIRCIEIMDVAFECCVFERTEFIESFITTCRFERTYEQNAPHIDFIDCTLSNNYFVNIDFKDLKFKNSTQLNLNVFKNCKNCSHSFDSSISAFGQEYNSIDLQTIIQSDNFSAHNLKSLFGILEPDIKNYVFGLTTEIKLQSVFISYSFVDREFAKHLNQSLMSKGVLTFLWEKDASGGKQLKSIMKENVEKFDRILFIASKNSLKSKACQFELTEGRLKQEKLWKDIYFPIHIDNYLFEIQKGDIRPLENQKEYWKNICELRNLNSIDFSVFIDNYNSKDYENSILKLVHDLKK
jgi:uncharacterized protein YjbI with pentapeptide repeats